ncbi:uncharacterized protein [Argopecten irradians]|uniref:uncharacterized protein n=1 Tax=Argopecten irradians TaxID=31199 RepID=UPI003715BAEC
MASQIRAGKKRVQFSAENMAQTIQSVRDGKPKMRAARLFGVPKTTLLDKLANRVPEAATKPGAKPVLTFAEENTLVNYAHLMADIGYPITRKEICYEVKRLMDMDGRKTPFTENPPGYNWYMGFLQRHPTLSERTPQALGHERAHISMPMIESWYDKMFNFLKNEVENWEAMVKKPRRVFNASLRIGVSSMRKDRESPCSNRLKTRLTSCYIQQITVMACFNAVGDYLPLFIVYPGQRFCDTGLEAFPGAIYALSENGWMDQDLFVSFLEHFYMFVDDVNIEEPVILFIDGHSTHMTAQAARFCAEHRIALHCFLLMQQT